MQKNIVTTVSFIGLLLLTCSISKSPVTENTLQIDLLSDRSVGVHDSLTIYIKAKNETAALLRYIITEPVLNIDDTIQGDFIRYAFDDTGTYEFRVRAIDDDNNLIDEGTLHVSVYSVTPVVTLVKSTNSYYVNDTLRFTAAALDSSSAISKYIWSFDNNAFDTTSDSVYKKFFKRSDVGNKTLYVKVIDADGVASQTDSMKIFVKHGAPVISVIHDTSITADDSVKLKASAADSNGKVIAYIWSLDGETFDTTKDSTFTVSFPSDSFGNENGLVKAYRMEGIFPKNDTVPRAVVLVQAMDDDSTLSEQAQILVSIRLTVTDVDGNVYHVVRIGNQLWTVENLRVTRYNDGTPIPLVTDDAEWAALSTPGFCFYNNTTNMDTINKFGALYNWYIVSPENPKNIAPKGWHVPSNVEWDTLQNYLIAKGYNWDGTITDNKISKSLAAKTDWEKYTFTGTIGCDLSKNNSTGFSGLPGGLRWVGVDFSGFLSQSECGIWRSTTENDTLSSWNYSLYFGSSNLGTGKSSKGCGFSIRLLRD